MRERGTHISAPTPEIRRSAKRSGFRARHGAVSALERNTAVNLTERVTERDGALLRVKTEQRVCLRHTRSVTPTIDSNYGTPHPTNGGMA